MSPIISISSSEFGVLEVNFLSLATYAFWRRQPLSIPRSDARWPPRRASNSAPHNRQKYKSGLQTILEDVACLSFAGDIPRIPPLTVSGSRVASRSRIKARVRIAKFEANHILK